MLLVRTKKQITKTVRAFNFVQRALLGLIRLHCIFGSLPYNLCCTGCFRGFLLIYKIPSVRSLSLEALHWQLQVGGREWSESTHPPLLYRWSNFRKNFLITFIPTNIFKYCISLFQFNSNIDSLRWRTDAGSFSNAAHGGSIYTVRRNACAIIREQLGINDIIGRFHLKCDKYCQ